MPKILFLIIRTTPLFVYNRRSVGCFFLGIGSAACPIQLQNHLFISFVYVKKQEDNQEEEHSDAVQR